MKRERIQFLVTCSIGYETPAERRYCVAASRDNLLAVSEGHLTRPIKATLVKPDPLDRPWLKRCVKLSRTLPSR